MPVCAVVPECAAVRPNGVLPAVEQRPGGDLPAALLADLAHHAVGRVLAQLELPAGQLPLVPLVPQQDTFPSCTATPLTETGNACVFIRPTLSAIN